MFDWIKLAILFLQLANKIVSWAHDQGLIDEGRDQAIAEAAAEVMRKTAVGKAILEKVNAMSGKQVDDALRGLEPR